MKGGGSTSDFDLPSELMVVGWSVVLCSVSYSTGSGNKKSLKMTE